MTEINISAEETADAISLIGGALDRVAQEQGTHEAVKAAVKNLSGNTAYLLNILEGISVFKLLSTLQEQIVETMWERNERNPSDVRIDN